MVGVRREVGRINHHPPISARCVRGIMECGNVTGL